MTKLQYIQLRFFLAVDIKIFEDVVDNLNSIEILIKN